MRMQAGAALALVAVSALPAARARAAALPSLNDQKAWTEEDKREFLDYLETTRPLPSRKARNIPLPRAGAGGERTASALELGPATATLFPFSDKGYGPTAEGLLGARALYERHFFSWMRGYAGFEAEPMRQREMDGADADLTRWAVPAGVEFALVPLGTPQTRYVLLRLGVAASDVTGAPRSAFSTPVAGPSLAWDAGLGYEWQLPDTRWRLNAALEGLRSMTSPGGDGYAGFDAAAALVYTF